MTTLSHHNLVESYLGGATKGRSSSMIIQQHGNATLLLGYRYAVYAYHGEFFSPEKERGVGVVIFGGWANSNIGGFAGSTTTKTSHFPHLRDQHNVLVSYHKASTALEKEIYEKADIITDNPIYAAPEIQHIDEVMTNLFPSD